MNFHPVPEILMLKFLCHINNSVEGILGVELEVEFSDRHFLVCKQFHSFIVSNFKLTRNFIFIFI